MSDDSFEAQLKVFIDRKLADEIEELRKDNRLLAAVARLAETERDTYKARYVAFSKALGSIANNSCCGPCREARLVAAKALREDGL